MDTTRHDAAVELQQLKPQPILGIRATIRIVDLGEAVGERIAALWGYLHRRDVQPAGPPFVRYHTFGETETDFEFGVPVVHPIASEHQDEDDEDRIVAGELPGGPAVTTSHPGPHQKLGEAYAQIEAWLSEHVREADGPTWEVYHWIDLSQDDGPITADVSSRRPTQLIQPIR
jgi:effector-binding domain-containing protein